MKKGLLVLSLTALVFTGLFTLTHCGSSASTANTYATSSNAGDFASWTINTAVSPATFSVSWTITDNTGAASSVLAVSGTCGAADPTYAYRKCTVVTSSATSGTATPPVAGTVFDVLELPGTALIVHPETAAGRSDASKDEIHVGFAMSACGSLTGGDFVQLQTAPSGSTNITNVFGLGRNDGTFKTNTHVDFNLYQVGTSFQMQYGTSDVGGIVTFGSSSCTGGITTIGTSTGTVRVGATSGGLYVVDMPRGSGGELVAKTTVAAAASDLASKNYVVLTFGNNSADLTAVTLGANTNGSIPITAMKNLSNSSVPSPLPTLYSSSSTLNNTPTKMAFASGQAGAYTSAAGNALYGTYPTAASIPGLFYTNSTDGSGNDTPTIIVAFKNTSGKVMLMGSNMSRNGGTGYYISGQFIGFQNSFSAPSS